MFYIIVYLGVGIYFLLMSFGILHKNYMKTWSKRRILALRIMAVGFLVLGGYYAWFYYFMSTPEGKAIQELQKQLHREYIKSLSNPQ
ncbi:MAG: hypothetical protein NZ853_04260 [Leptospiraceae bacterium]|nr:hypothetical protein [Leptospiraceae bacterium]MDW7975387.1 hypothetical protein [Leptospiraceae bacterium]